jgi:hypothetical protein
MYINGVKVNEVLTGNVPASNTFNELTLRDISGSNFYGKINKLEVYKTALTDIEIQNL